MCQNGKLPNKPSSVIVYSDEQIQDMISNCIGTNGSVIGIGRSFNLRSCFVTTTTYKILVILQRETLQNLILLDTRDITKYNFNGPIFLHWGGKTDSYFNVLCHRNSKLAFPSGLYVGSDEEKII